MCEVYSQQVLFTRIAARPLVIGHRGAPALAAPNSLAGIEAAASSGADAVELDVGSGLIVGHPGEEPEGPPLALGEALAFLAPLPLMVQLDLKDVGIEAQVAAELRAHGLMERAFASSTSRRALAALAAAAPGLPLVAGYPRDRLGAASLPWPRALERAAAAALRRAMPVRARLLLSGPAQALALHHALVSPAVVEAVRGRGAALIAWTVNDPLRVAALAGLGVDGIVSDDPRMVRDVLGTLSGL
jgi:glycerophosphoryl diester phosphodiesterase